MSNNNSNNLVTFKVWHKGQSVYGVNVTSATSATDLYERASSLLQLYRNVGWAKTKLVMTSFEADLLDFQEAWYNGGRQTSVGVAKRMFGNNVRFVGDNKAVWLFGHVSLNKVDTPTLMLEHYCFNSSRPISGLDKGLILDLFNAWGIPSGLLGQWSLEEVARLLPEVPQRLVIRALHGA